ncbi:MAG: hypothetical protein ACIAQZ_12740 [Sedimentisphaeraceae bacterium JB056]
MDKESDLFNVSGYTAIVCLMLAFFSFPALSEIVNGDFELSEPNDLGSIPTGWITENYAMVHDTFTPVFERGQSVTWSFPDSTVTPAEGESFLVISTGDIGVDTASTYGLAKQLCTFEEGQTLHGKYFFGTGDYLGWNDYAEIWLAPYDPNVSRGITIQSVDVSIVGDYQSTDGWQTFSHTFTAQDAGDYYIIFGVYDKQDAIYKSYLMIDDVKCSTLPPGGDFNADGDVNYEDITTFNEVLYQDCTDPNAICTYTDISGNEVSYDYNQDGLLTPEDVVPVTQNWLWNDESY